MPWPFSRNRSSNVLDTAAVPMLSFVLLRAGLIPAFVRRPSSILGRFRPLMNLRSSRETGRKIAVPSAFPIRFVEDAERADLHSCNEIARGNGDGGTNGWGWKLL